MKKIFIITLLLILSYILESPAQVWERLSFSEDCRAIAGVDSIFFVGTYYAGMYYSNNYCETLIEINEGLKSQNIFSIIIVDTFCFIGTFKGGCYKTSIRNINWEVANNGLKDLNIIDFMYNDNTLYAATTNGLFISSDLGLNWNLSSNGLVSYSCRSLAKTDNEIILGTDENIYISTNNGVNWVPKNNGIDNGVNSIDVNCLVADNNKIYLGLWNGAGIFISTNSGEVWNLFRDGLNNYYYISDIIIVEKEYVVSSMGGGVFFCDYNSNHWNSLNQGLNLDPPFYESIKSLYWDKKYIFSASTQGLLRMERSKIQTGVNSKNKSKNILFPNPTSDYIQINTETIIDKIEIFDVLGNTRITHPCIPSQEGSYRFDVSQLQSGIYFCTLKAGEYAETVKMVVLK
ncbi:T9SS type A sorting domain-containing protein [Bacteroidota bacterium]